MTLLIKFFEFVVQITIWGHLTIDMQIRHHKSEIKLRMIGTSNKLLTITTEDWPVHHSNLAQF